MTIQSMAIFATKEAVTNIFRTVRVMPAEKIDWQPAPTSRSVLDQLQEIVLTSQWFIQMIKDKQFPAMDPEDFAKSKEERKQWDTIDKCEEELLKRNEVLYSVISNVTDDELAVEVDLPWGEGMKATIASILSYHYWNIVYHTGQINYIQTLYGDNEMH